MRLALQLQFPEVYTFPASVWRELLTPYLREEEDAPLRSYLEELKSNGIAMHPLFVQIRKALPDLVYDNDDIFPQWFGSVGEPPARTRCVADDITISFCTRLFGDAFPFYYDCLGIFHSEESDSADEEKAEEEEEEVAATPKRGSKRKVVTPTAPKKKKKGKRAAAAADSDSE